MGAMDVPELIRVAEARGVATSYLTSQGREVAVSPGFSICIIRSSVYVRCPRGALYNPVLMVDQALT
jgi:hypothetical protein